MTNIRRKDIARAFSRLVSSAALLLMVTDASWGAIAIGEAAPAFSGKSAAGTDQTLAMHKGKYVVLEWTNHGCPYVKKHYETGNMQRLQGDAIAKGAVWITVISSAPGKQGYSTPVEALADAAASGAKPSAILLDSDGTIGKLYGATTTPHMFVIDPEGILIYMGAIDDQPSFDRDGIGNATNWVQRALGQAMANEPVTTPSTKAYGCAVKY